MFKLKIKKGDSVQVIAGAGKGHKGEVIELDNKRLKVRVSGHALKTHYDKEKGLFQQEGFVDYSNIKLASATKKKKAKKKTTKKAASKKTTTKKTTKKAASKKTTSKKASTEK